MANIIILNRSQRQFSGLKLPGGKSIDMDPGKTVELDEKTAEAILKQYPRDLVKASEVRQDTGELTAKADELTKREADLVARETALTTRADELAAKADELTKREAALKKAEEKK